MITWVDIWLTIFLYNLKIFFDISPSLLLQLCFNSIKKNIWSFPNKTLYRMWRMKWMIFQRVTKKICIVWFRKNCPEFFTCTTYIDKLFKSEIFLLIFSLNNLLFTAGIIEAFNINHLHIFYNLFYEFVLSI